MANVFETRLPIDKVFDLKGSTYGRTNPDANGVQKDLDWESQNRKIFVDPGTRQSLLHQLKLDAQFLKNNHIIDYSLLVGIHEKELHPNATASTDAITITPNTQQYIPFHQRDFGGIQSMDQKQIYFLGVIDIFINYGLRKKSESFVKTFWTGDSDGISVTEPEQYCIRYLNFMSKITK
jgi:1-phosphatidylinositol-4-phosphate 5-kinase